MGRDANTPEWVQHIAFKVESEQTLLETKARLQAEGIEVVGPTDHAIFKSIYFFDPNGHRLELAADVVNVERGGQQKLAVQVLREGGFAAPVTLAMTGLPEGVTAADVVVAPNQNRGELVVQAAKTARIVAARAQVVGRTEAEGQPHTTAAAMPRRPKEASP